MKHKQIGVFIGDVTQNFSSRVCKAISARADEYGYDVYFFTLFTTTGDNLLYAEGERKIFELPDYSTLDGIIVAMDTINIPGCRELLLKKLATVTCPVVCLREPVEGFYNVMVDEDTSMERMIRHFVEVHKFRDICFMTGRMEMVDAQKRFSCYKRIMEEYGIEVDESKVYYGNYWSRGPEAVEHFLSSRISSYPEAIVCANDYMAVSVCVELERRGIRVPEDICVSGYDDLLEAKQCHPPLSSVAVPIEAMADRAVDLIDEVARGEKPDKQQYVAVIEKYRSSCGCRRHKVKSEWGNLNLKLEEQRAVNAHTIFMNGDMEGVTDEKLLLTTAHKYSYRNNAKRIWVCLCDETEELTEEERNVGSTRLEFTNNMVLRSVTTMNGGLHLDNLRFPRSELIPEETRKEMENASFFFVPLHYKNHILGYVALAYENYEHYNDFVQPWMMNFAVALENYRLYQRLNAMEEIKRVYKQDTLTGIPNRRGFEEQARKVYGDAAFLKKHVAVISVDMDRLKQINDEFGHTAGDDALRRVATALSTVAGDNTAIGRTGGDEFCVVLRVEAPGDGERFIVALREVLEKVNAQYGEEYIAEVSCGMYEVKDASKVPLIRALEMSDEQMYEDKKKRKAERKN